MIRASLWAMVLLIAGALTFLYVDMSNRGAAADGAYGTPFTLVDQNGKTFSSKELAGKPYALFFGYTHCPDVCPTTLFELASRRQKIETRGGEFGIVFISIDPERDTPAILKDYVNAVDPHIIALTGKSADIAKVAKGWGAYYRKQGTGEDYLMDHTATTFLIDAKGDLAGTLAYGEDPKAVTGKLDKLAGV
ncbi:SCO family protein [Jiella sp. CQZ9-1]|uniref:SCO family protein n=2 Tax=Jiella flava TaxID=2816857 RepID=A0A939JUR1_9HYPH|nr:SCO family protein [Jiella flava]